MALAVTREAEDFPPPLGPTSIRPLDAVLDESLGRGQPETRTARLNLLFYQPLRLSVVVGSGELRKEVEDDGFELAERSYELTRQHTRVCKAARSEVRLSDGTQIWRDARNWAEERAQIQRQLRARRLIWTESDEKRMTAIEWRMQAMDLDG
eukprot:471003-Pleurochrysis_carterae.AAC.6